MARIHRGTVQKKKKKDLNDPDNHNGVIIHIESNILESELKWALGTITTKKNYWWWCNSSWAISNPKRWCCKSSALNLPANLENSVVAHRIGKGQFSFQCQKMLNYHLIALISHASKVMLKIRQTRLQQYVNRTSRCSSWI